MKRFPFPAKMYDGPVEDDFLRKAGNGRSYARGYHGGIDLPAGDVPPRRRKLVNAWRSRVAEVGNVFGSAYGNQVLLEHRNKRKGLRWFSFYAHLDHVKVRRGQKLRRAGKTIGYAGNTGNSSGPHLHFELNSGSWWEPINPHPYLEEVRKRDLKRRRRLRRKKK